MAEVERLKKADSATKAFAEIRKRMDSVAAEDISIAIRAIDRGDFDNTSPK